MKRSPLKRKSKTKLAQLKDRTWTLCREITRKLHGNTCYSCGLKYLEGSNWHTGHFIASSICSTALRYDLKNLRPQCFKCNITLGGNHYEYGKKLEEEFGIEYVQKLKLDNEKTKGKKYDTLWYEAKISELEQILEQL